METLFLIVSLLLNVTYAKPYHLKEAPSGQIPVEYLANNSMDVESADLDADGDPDLVIAMEFRPNVILINDGKGKFAFDENRLPKKNHDSEDVELADFDGDGDIDIMFGSEDDEIHEYYLNDGHANFTDVSDRIPVRSVCNAVKAGDFDKDGDIDLILGNSGSEIFLENNGNGFFSDETTKRLPPDNSITQDVEAADIDHDGDEDLIIGNEDGNKIYINDGKGYFKNETSSRLPGRNEETRKVDVADIDGDGEVDLFFSNVNWNGNKETGNRLLVNDGKGFFKDVTATQFHAPNNMHTGDINFVDLNGDKAMDMVIGNLVDGYMQVCLNDGAGNFTEASSEIFSGKIVGEAISVLVKDLTGDGIPDVYFGIFRAPDRMFIGSN